MNRTKFLSKIALAASLSLALALTFSCSSDEDCSAHYKSACPESF